MTFTLNNLIIFGGLLLLGFVGSALADRTGRIPGITGMIAVGFLAGPSVLGLVDADMLSESRVFVDIALGLILFQLGLLLDVRALFSDRKIWLTAVIECVATFAAVFFALKLLGVAPLSAALAAAVAVSSSPAVLLMVSRELGAKGPVTDTALKLVAFNNIVAFLLYTAILPFLHFDQQAELAVIIGQPLLQLVGSTVLGGVLAVVLIRLSRWLLPRGGDAFVLVVALVLLALGLSKTLSVSPLLSLLAMGLLVRNLDSPEHLREVQFGRGGELFFLILFVFAGANLHLDHLIHAAIPAVVFVLARAGAKSLSTFAVLRMHGMATVPSAMTGLTLVPMAGLAIGLVQSTETLYPGFTATLSAVVLGAVAILETVGPIATEFALKRAGEVSADASVKH